MINVIIDTDGHGIKLEATVEIEFIFLLNDDVN